MPQHDALVESLLLAGYRSFGRDAQRFKRFAKINLLIGPNNSGKSNVLRFFHEVYRKLGPQMPQNRWQPDRLDRHIPDGSPFRYGFKLSLEQAAIAAFVAPKIADATRHRDSIQQVMEVFEKKANLDGTDDVWFDFDQGGNIAADTWEGAFRVLNDQEMYRLWNALTGRSAGARDAHWFPETLKVLTPAGNFGGFSVEMIPAIRNVGKKGTQPSGFGGEGLIERLAKLQNPDVHSQPDRERFERVSAFLRSVTDNRSARIEIPYDRDTIVVHMNGKALPLESLGTGIHEVIILAAASTILENTVVCMEEPEIHLNPILQRKFVRYLAESTSNQYFIATHSAALMDTPDAEIYHVQLQGGQSRVLRVSSDRQRSTVCEDLGYHPSDLLQANCLIWVEGPSDRLYLNYWISKYAPELQEGVHYSIMFYGGRLAAHLSGNDIDEVIKEFISLRRLNRRAVILIDSDRTGKDGDLNATKQRLVSEFNVGPGHAWVTDGREIENYIPADQVREAIEEVMPSATSTSKFGRYDKVLAIKTVGGKSEQAPKVEVAKYVTANFGIDDSRLDLKERLTALVNFIRESNPSNERVTA